MQSGKKPVFFFWMAHARLWSSSSYPDTMTSMTLPSVSLFLQSPPQASRPPTPCRRRRGSRWAWAVLPGEAGMTGWWACLTARARRCRVWASASASRGSSLSWRLRQWSAFLYYFFLHLCSHQAKVVTWLHMVCSGSVQSVVMYWRRQITYFRCKPRAPKWPFCLVAPHLYYFSHYFLQKSFAQS